MDETIDLEINEPERELPDLARYGILEVQPGVCLDSQENRRIIRAHRLKWEPAITTAGDDTNFLRVITPEMREARALRDKGPILTNPKDANSDYLSGLDLLLVTDVDAIVPIWVLAATRRYDLTMRERERRNNPRFSPSTQSAPGRCRALRMDGKRCLNWHGGMDVTDGLCRIHLNTKSETVYPSTETRARNRILAAALMAAETMEELAETAASESVKLGAAKELLDRAGIRGGTELNVKSEITVIDAAAIVRERLAAIADRTHQKELREAELAEELVLEAIVVEDADNA